MSLRYRFSMFHLWILTFFFGNDGKKICKIVFTFSKSFRGWNTKKKERRSQRNYYNFCKFCFFFLRFGIRCMCTCFFFFYDIAIHFFVSMSCVSVVLFWIEQWPVNTTANRECSCCRTKKNSNNRQKNKWKEVEKKEEIIMKNTIPCNSHIISMLMRNEPGVCA